MRSLRLVLLMCLHLLFWGIFLRHVPFFSSSLHFLDFDNYLHLWRDIFAGNNPYTVSHMITLGPPTVLIPYFPFLFFPVAIGQLFFFLLNVMMGYLLCWLLTVHLFKKKHNTFLFLSLLLFCTFPARFSLLMGQPGLLIAYAITYLLFEKKHTLIRVWFLVLSKTFFVFMLLSWCKQKKKEVLFVVCGILLTSVAFLPFLPIDWYTFYGTHTLAQTSTGVLSDTTTDYYNQSLKSTLHRFSSDALYIPTLVLFLAVMTLYIYKKQDMFVALMVSILISPVVWQHYLVFLFPIFITVYAYEVRWRRFLVVTSFCLCSWAYPMLHTEPKTLIYALLASHMFLGMIILLAILLTRQEKRYN